MPLKSIFLSGYSGRMGQELRKIVDNSVDSSVSIGGGFSKNDQFGLDKGNDLVIDFSLPSAIEKIVEACRSHNMPLLSGTTGFTEDQFLKLKELSSEVPVFWSSNMSLGVYLFHQLIKVFAQAKKSDIQFSIHEIHHTKKIDQPSGTAISLAQTAEGAGLKIGNITSDREGEVPGTHFFHGELGDSEVLTIIHEAKNRSLFAQGALKVGHWLVDQPPGFYKMADFVSSLK